MNEVKIVLLTLITENKRSKVIAEGFADMLQKDLGAEWEILNIEKYQKFENSYKIEFKGSINDKSKDELNTLLIRLSDKFLSPWMIYYHKTDNSIELIYNKDTNTQIRRAAFNVIKWGHLKISK